jgi:tetratricopeptide (TPR) repeat protein/TolB-like protein
LTEGEGSAEGSPDAYWERVRALFHAAGELPDEARQRFLEEACPDDAAMRDEVLSLLASDALADDFLERKPLRGFVPGDVVAGRYRVDQLLGSGGMGEVYQAHDGELRESIALKIIRPGFARSPRVLARFRREIQLARRVTHPNVCRIYDVARDPDRKLSFVSMELLHGRTLSARLREGGRMTIAEALPIVKQLAAGLDAAHAASIVHRDFKSANVMLVPAGNATRAVITDFDLAHETGASEDREMSRLTDTGTIIGTPDYMAPEQLEDGPLTPATDVYALGIVLFEMMTGRLPFEGNTPLSLALSRLQTPAPSPRRWAPELDARWEAVILRCLERDPARRYASAGAVAAALDAASPMPARVKPEAPQRRRFLGAGIALIVSLAVIALALVMQRRESKPAAMPPPRAVAASAVTPRRAVAMLGFRDLSGKPGDAWLDGAFAELLSNELSATETLRVVPNDDVAQLRADLSLRDGDPIARTTLPRIRERLAADVVVTGSYLTVTQGAGRELRLDVRMQDATTGETLGTISETGTEGELFALVARAGGRLRTQLGAAPLTAEAGAGLRASHPANAEATRAYVEGITKLRRFDALAARASLERAVATEPSYPMSHAALAEALWNLGNEKPATESADRALSLAAKLGREERLSIEARANVFHKEFDKAIEIYRSLLTFYPDELAYGLRLGAVQVSAGKAKDALATVDKLRALPAPMRDEPGIDLIAADAYHLMHESAKELAVAEQAEAKGAASNMRGIVARAKSNQAYANRDLGHPNRSVALLEEAAKIYEDIGDRAGSARSLSNLGLSLWNRGDLNAAEPILERALIIHRQVGSRSFESRTLNNIGILRFMKGNIEGAEKVWMEALVVQRESNFLTAMAPTLSNLGGARQLQGDMAGAEKFYREAIAVSRKTDDRFGEATGLTNLAEMLRLRGDLAASKKPYAEGLAISRQLEMPLQESYTLAAMGEMALWQDDFAEARHLHTAAIAMRRKANDKVTVAQSQAMIANLDLEEGKPAEGEAQAREAIAVFAKENAAEEEAIAQEVLARILLARGRTADAEQALKRARELTKTSHTLGLLSAIAASEARVLIAQGRFDPAVKRAGEAVAIAEKSHVLVNELEARLVLATAETRRGRSAEGRQVRADVARRAAVRGLRLIAKKAA